MAGDLLPRFLLMVDCQRSDLPLLLLQSRVLLFTGLSIEIT